MMVALPMMIMSTVSAMVMMSTMVWWLWPKARLEHDNLLGDNDFIRRPSNISLARTNTPPKQKTSWWPAWYQWWWGSQENNYIISLYLNDYYIFQRDKWTINNQTPTNRALWHKTESPHLVFALVVGLQSVPWFKLKYFHLLLLENLAFVHIFKRRIRGDLGDEKWDIFCLQLLSFPPCCLNDQSFCLPGPPIPLSTFFTHSVNILCRICTMCAMYNASVSAQSILYIFVRHCEQCEQGTHCTMPPRRSRVTLSSSLWKRARLHQRIIAFAKFQTHRVKKPPKCCQTRIHLPQDTSHSTTRHPLQIHSIKTEIQQQLIVGQNEIKL